MNKFDPNAIPPPSCAPPVFQEPSPSEDEGPIQLLPPEKLSQILEYITDISDQWSLRFVNREWCNIATDVIRLKDKNVCALEDVQEFLHFMMSQLNAENRRWDIQRLQSLEQNLEPLLQSPLFGPRGYITVLFKIGKIMMGKKVDEAAFPPSEFTKMYFEIPKCRFTASGRSIISEYTRMYFEIPEYRGTAAGRPIIRDDTFFNALDRLMAMKDTEGAYLILRKACRFFKGASLRKSYSAFLLQGDLQRARNIYFRMVPMVPKVLSQEMKARLIRSTFKQQGVEDCPYVNCPAPSFIQSLTAEVRFLIECDLSMAIWMESPGKMLLALLEIGEHLNQVEESLESRKKWGQNLYLQGSESDDFFRETRQISRVEGSIFLGWMKDGARRVPEEWIHQLALQLIQQSNFSEGFTIPSNVIEKTIMQNIIAGNLDGTNEDTMSFGEFHEEFMKCKQELKDSFLWLELVRNKIAVSQEEFLGVSEEERQLITEQLASYGLLRP